jgi:hypothetical protein
LPTGPTSHVSSGGWSRTNTGGFKARSPAIRRPRNRGSSPRAEREGVEPSRLIARPFSGRLPSPVGLPFRSSCGGRNRTCNRLLNREPPYHWATPQKVRTVGMQTHAFRFPKPADSQAFLRPEQEHPAGIEPAHSAMRRAEGRKPPECCYITGAIGTRGTRTLTTLVKSQVCCR